MTRRSSLYRQLTLGLLPVFSPLSWFSLSRLGKLRQLPSPWPALLLGFLGVQVIAALLAPEPLWSGVLALVRGLLVIALITSGFLLGRADAYRPVLIGYAAVALTAFAATLAAQPGEVLSTRLIHPYYTSVSLGLAGALGLLVAVTWQRGPLPWRLLGGALSLGMFLWSGSRGPLIALAAGLLAAFAVNVRGQWRAALGAVLATGALLFSLQMAGTGGVGSRFLDSTLNSRDTYWTDALTTAQAHPWGGVGPYQLGPFLSTQYSEGSCQLWLPNEEYGLKECPPVMNAIRGAWLIAHNTAFHLLGETGVIGLTGWLALTAALAVTAWRSRDPLINGVTWAVAAMGLVDNPTLLPGLGHAELYWLLSGTGIALAQAARHAESPSTPALPPPLGAAAPALALALLAYLTVPAWLDRIRPGARALPTATLTAVTVPQRLQVNEVAAVFLKVQTSENRLRLQGQACSAEQCRTVANVSLKTVEQGWQYFGIKIPETGRYTLTLTLFDESGGSGLRLSRVLGKWQGVVEVE